MMSMFFMGMLLAVFSFFFIGSSMMVFLVLNLQTYVIEWSIWGMVSSNVPMIIVLDKFSIIMMMTVMVISLSVYLFSLYYMEGEQRIFSFYLILSVFVLSMLVLILSPGIFSLFIGWDGLGISSFLLVMFYSNVKSFGASLLTVMSNRLGDSMILSAIVMMLFSESLVNSCSLVKSDMNFIMTYVVFFFLIGVTTKSAQLPFSAWLPAAMAAPTPVSALVHSSTLVTAGVYILIRFSAAITDMSFYILIVGGLTTLCASVSALKEPDMKKMIALSTLSQLGIMMVAIGIGSPILSFIHLVAHAFFKALMFIGAGDLIHNFMGMQELKIFGGGVFSSPLTSSFIVAAKVALCGLPFFSGFFSKETILENMMIFYNFSLFMYFYMILSISLTVMYSTRFLLKVMLSPSNWFVSNLKSSLNFYLISSMSVLLIPGITWGSWMKSFFLQDLILSFSPWFPKFLIIISLFSSFFLMVVEIKMKKNFYKASDLGFYIWQSPSMSYFSFIMMGTVEKINSGTMVKFLSKILHEISALFSMKMFLGWSSVMKSIMRSMSLVVIMLFLI